MRTASLYKFNESYTGAPESSVPLGLDISHLRPGMCAANPLQAGNSRTSADFALSTKSSTVSRQKIIGIALALF
jgi:hypothetical protein